MILKYKFSNFGVFKDEVEFSLIPGKVTQRFNDNVAKVNDKLKVSKIAVIVGENAGGKTSFMKSLDFFKYTIEENDSKSKKNLQNGYNDNSQSFDIEILDGQYIYTYKLILDSYSLISEEFLVRKNTQKEEKNEEVYKITRVSLDKNNVNNEMQNNYEFRYLEKYIDKALMNVVKSQFNKGLMINSLNILGIKLVVDFRKYVLENLIVSIPDSGSYNRYKSFEKTQKDLMILKTKEFLEIFSLVDSTIIDVEINDEKPFEESIIVRKLGDEKFKIYISEDSSGVNEFFAWAISLWQVIYENKILFADEVDRVLNSILAARVVNYVKACSTKGQFIFTTHNVMHLDTNVFMKEQIYFVDKDYKTLEAEMYSLADFEDYKYDNNKVYDLYLKGLLGGVPNA
ncbi:MAG: AAA family ATPase [Sarcina sp.]